MQKLVGITEEALGGLTAPPPYVASETVPRYIEFVGPGMRLEVPNSQLRQLIQETGGEIPTTLHQSPQTGKSGPGKHRPLSTQGLPPAWENIHTVDEEGPTPDRSREVYTPDDEEADYSSDLPRRKTLPGHGHPPSGLGLNLKDRTISWSAGTLPSPERAAAHPRVQLHPSSFTARPTSMYVTSSVNTWTPAPFHHSPHPPPPPPLPLPPLPPAPSPARRALVTQHPPLEYRPPPGMPAQNWHQQPNSETCIMPDVSHFIHYVTTVDDHADNMYPRSDNTRYSEHNLVPRDWATAPSTTGARVVSPPRSPFSVSPEDFRSMPTAPPQNFTTRAGSTRCVAKYEYQGSPAHGEVSLQAGQLYDVIPQHDSPCKKPSAGWLAGSQYIDTGGGVVCPGVWIESQSPYSPSGFAPARNFRDHY